MATHYTKVGKIQVPTEAFKGFSKEELSLRLGGNQSQNTVDQLYKALHPNEKKPAKKKAAPKPKEDDGE